MPSERARVLFLSQCLPYPPHSGVTRRTYNIIRQLEIEFSVLLVPFYRRNHQPSSAAVTFAVQHLQESIDGVAEPAPIPSEYSRWRRLWDHFRSAVSGLPYTYYEYQHPEFEQQLKMALQRWSPDLLHVDSLDLVRWISMLGDRLFTCTHHSIESDLLRQRGNVVGNRVLRGYIRYQAGLVARTERKFANKAALNVMMSDLDAQRLKELAPGSQTVTVPNGVDTDYFRPLGVPQIQGRVVFLGPSYMLPNRDGIEYFIDKVWPAILEKWPGATFEVVGSCDEENRRRFEVVEGVSCAGFVDDIRPLLARASCFVVPIRVGGGTRLKILEAWAMGCPVVSTSVGCEGLATSDGGNILVRDDPREFANAVVEVLASGSSLGARLGEAGRSTAVERYSWQIVGEVLRKAYRDLLC